MQLYEKKVQILKEKFSECLSKESIYQKIMELGMHLDPLEEKDKIDENLVSGCQSILYLKASFEQNTMTFKADANALISKGLAYLLLYVYSGEAPETILKTPPLFLNDLNIYSSLSLNRSNGLSQILLKIKQSSLQYLG